MIYIVKMEGRTVYEGRSLKKAREAYISCYPHGQFWELA